MHEFTLSVKGSDAGERRLSLLPMDQLKDLYLSWCYLPCEPTFDGINSLTRLYVLGVRTSTKLLLHLLSNCSLLKSLSLIMLPRQFVGIMFPAKCGAQHKLPSTLVNLKYFCVKQLCFVDVFDNFASLAFAFILRNSPYLEKLHIQMVNYMTLKNPEVGSFTVESHSDILPEHLNELEITNLSNMKRELNFVKFVLAKSPELKRLKILLFCKIPEELSSHVRIQRVLPGPVKGGGPEGTDDREEISPPLMKEHIEGHVSALKSLIKSHNQRNKGDPIHLDFKLEDTEVQDHGIAKGKEVMDEDLRKPFKEARRTPLTRRIIKLAGPEYKMHTNIKLYDGTTDPEDHLSRFARWFERLSRDNIHEWVDLREAFAARYSVRRVCFKEPHEITKIVRNANESLTTFKERWTVETSFIMGVPEVMKISSFMDLVKSPELVKRFSNKVPATVNEMMERLDDFVRSEEAYASTELLKGEVGETHCKMSLSFNGRDNRSF
ncbi:hypothetical protein Tco_1237416 [Tanacetum coccineum]